MEENEQQKKQQQIAQMVYQQETRNSQYQVSEIPIHLHNDADAPAIPAQNLNFTNFMVWGQVALVGGSAAVTNVNIATTSTILLTSTISYAGTTLRGNCNDGTAVIQGGTGTETVHFLIIF